MKRKNFYDGSRARATLAPSLSGLECYFFFIIRKIEFSYIYIKINIFYMRIGTWVYTWLVYERASIYIIRKSRLGDWRYIVERSRVQKFLKNIFIKRKFFFVEMNGRENFYDGSRARATLAPSLSGLECYFFLKLEKKGRRAVVAWRSHLSPSFLLSPFSPLFQFNLLFSCTFYYIGLLILIWFLFFFLFFCSVALNGTKRSWKRRR